jgi:hypothetical protein
MDERIRNLFGESGQTERLIAADDPDLGHQVIAAATRLDRGEVERASRQTLGNAIQALGEMGRRFLDEFRAFFPAFPLSAHQGGWQAFLPPLPADVDAFLSADRARAA